MHSERAERCTASCGFLLAPRGVPAVVGGCTRVCRVGPLAPRSRLEPAGSGSWPGDRGFWICRICFFSRTLSVQFRPKAQRCIDATRKAKHDPFRDQAMRDAAVGRQRPLRNSLTGRSGWRGRPKYRRGCSATAEATTANVTMTGEGHLGDGSNRRGSASGCFLDSGYMCVASPTRQRTGHLSGLALIKAHEHASKQQRAPKVLALAWALRRGQEFFSTPITLPTFSFPFVSSV